MLQERLLKQTLLAKVISKRPALERSQTRCDDYFEDIGWKRLGLKSPKQKYERWWRPGPSKEIPGPGQKYSRAPKIFSSIYCNITNAPQCS